MGYVGLHNLGCTCYMASLMQQVCGLQPCNPATLQPCYPTTLLHCNPATLFVACNPPTSRPSLQTFMCPKLVDGLLTADAEQAGNQADMLRELQLMLTFLRYSNSQAYWPHGFCQAFRDFDGQCLAPTEQVSSSNGVSKAGEPNAINQDITRSPRPHHHPQPPPTPPPHPT